ncbi:MAG: DUF4160 domain-containing protein [Acidobacteria bacterium]|nr:DUF4160 domain-containing protein [Acidobacteriota bacterium]
MPTVFRQAGFSFVIYTDDHEPSHTHVKKAGKEVVINLGDAQTAPHLRENKRMSAQSVRKAIRLAYQYQEELIAAWEEFHQ